MASPKDALDYAMRMVGNMPLDDPKLVYRLLDDAHKKLWMAAPWRWSVAFLEILTVANDTQDYALGTTYPVVHLTQAAITAGQEKYDLSIAGALPVTTAIKGRPGQIQFIDGSPQSVRLFPMPTGYPTSNPPKLIVAYKKTPTTITAANYTDDYATTFSIPDEWFHVYQEVVLLKAYQFSNSPRLGAVETMPQGVRYSGQFGAVEAALASMHAAEAKFFDTLGQVVTNG